MTDDENKMLESLSRKLANDIEGDVSYSKLSYSDRLFFVMGMKDRMIAEAGFDTGLRIWKAVVDELEIILAKKNNKLH